MVQISKLWQTVKQKLHRRSETTGLIRRYRWVIGFLLAICGIGLIIAAYRFRWSGTGFLNKTLWDWLQLLIIPLALAGVALLFNRAQHKDEQTSADNNQQEAALRDYLDKMSDFLLKENLIPSQQSDKVRKLARARTLTVLSRLDGSRKGSVIRFLYEADLINVDVEGSIMDLSGGDLRGADLSDASLNGIKLSKTDLSKANLNHTFLEHADLKGANLSGANLREAFLNKADLRAISKKEARLGNSSTLAHIIPTNLSGANLCQASLVEANLTGVNLTKADLRGAGLGLANLASANLSSANLERAFLQETDLHMANLTKANLAKADLTQTNLLRATLKGANLNDSDLSSTFIAQDQLSTIKSKRYIPPKNLRNGL